jgi:hypothetical protein
MNEKNILAHTFKNIQFSPAVRDNRSLVCVCVCVCVCFDMYTLTQTTQFHFPSVS